MTGVTPRLNLAQTVGSRVAFCEWRGDVSSRAVSSANRPVSALSAYDLPLDALKEGDHEFAYELDDAFFAAYESPLVAGGRFDVRIEVVRVGNQFSLDLDVAGSASVTCDRCLGAFPLRLAVSDELVIKFDAGAARESEDVIFLPFGTERFDAAKAILDAIGLALPMKVTHDDADLNCDPSVTQFLVAEATDGAEAPTEADPTEIPEDSPWSALRGLRTQPSDN